MVHAIGKLQGNSEAAGLKQIKRINREKGTRQAIRVPTTWIQKTPANAVLTTFLNLLKKWAPSIAATGVLLPALGSTSRQAHREQGKAPGSKVLAQKTNVNHAHRRG
jgi:hypothetical protein